MKNIVYAIISVLFAITAHAQREMIGFTAGLNFSTFEGDGTSQFSTKAGLTGGILIDTHLKKKYGLEIGLIYSDKGTQYTNVTSGGYLTNSGYSIDFKYFELPVSFKYLSRDSLGFMIAAGPYIGLLMKASVDDGNGNQADIGNYFKGYDVGLNVSIGYQFRSGFGMALKYEPGLVNIVRDPSNPTTGGSNNNSVIAFTFFYLQ